jgi:hypothetical protein
MDDEIAGLITRLLKKVLFVDKHISADVILSTREQDNFLGKCDYILFYSVKINVEMILLLQIFVVCI